MFISITKPNILESKVLASSQLFINFNLKTDNNSNASSKWVIMIFTPDDYLQILKFLVFIFSFSMLIFRVKYIEIHNIHY